MKLYSNTALIRSAVVCDDDQIRSSLVFLNAWPGGGIAERKFLGKRSLSAGYRGASAAARLPINIIPLCMAATQVWLMAMTPKTATHAAAHRHVHAADLSIICYNFAALCIILHCTKSF